MTDGQQTASGRRRGLLGLAAVAVCVVAILVFRPGPPAVPPTIDPAIDPGQAVPTAVKSRGDRVVLVADLREADASCGCGQIIRRVRSMTAKGVAVLEIDPRKAPERASSYKALVNPTVIITTADGVEVRRFEGEDANTLSMLDAELQRLTSSP